MPLSFYRSTFFGFFILYAVFSGITAFHNGAEGFDGYSFLGQTWRVTDPAHENHFYEPARPRTFVLVMSVVDKIGQTLLHRHPTINEYHVVTWILVLSTILLWVWALKPLLNESIALLTGVLLLFHYLYFLHTAFVLADVLSSTLGLS